MKYNMWSNVNVPDSVNMQPGSDEFIIRTEYNLKMMEDGQRTSPKKMKRFRSAFTTEQVNYLEEQFKKFPYIGNAQRKEVANVLSISERAVKIWFQNRRMKEKKETIVKEFDDEQTNRKSLEFVKDQLNNGSTLSANDQEPYSLSLLANVKKPDCDQVMMTNNSLSGLNIGLPNVGSGYKVLEGGMTPVRCHTTYTPTISVKPPQLLSNNYMKSAEFSIDLCKKYRNDSSSSPNFLKLPSVKEEDIKPKIEEMPLNNIITEQMVPEDLSSNRKTNVLSTSQVPLPSNAPSNPGYISVIPAVTPFYAQPYYSSGGVVWKPLTVMPTPSAPGSSITPVTASSTLSTSVGAIPTVAEVRPKKGCSCDCHVKPVVPFNVQQQAPTPQYIITAVQFPNPSAP